MITSPPIVRKDDLTSHVCADCGGVIVGPFVKREENGVATYFHVHRCERTKAHRPLAGKAFPWNARTFRSGD